MVEIISLLEGAIEGSGRLDDQIARAVGWREPDSGHPLVHIPPPSYTTSLDAAMTLVPGGWQRQVFETRSGKWDARLIRLGDSECVTSMYAATGPLAVCIAALKARL